MEILARPIVELGKCLCVPLIKDHCGYIYCYAENVKKLEDEVESLKTQREDMNAKLDEHSRLNRNPLPGVKKWMGSVDKAVVEAEILSGQMKEEQRCLMGWCPNLRWRHEVGRQATEQIDQVQQLKEKGDRFLSSVTISEPRPPPDVEEIRSGNKFVATVVATTVMEQVMDALGDNDVTSIGIYGMGGIGKTTLVNNINNKLKGSTFFNMVIFVIVSQNQNLNVIQDQIAERLGMKLLDKVNYLRANRLLEEFRKLKRVLIILDDVWTELKVVELGLPRKNEHDCCKIIVTTRNREVCVQMGMDVMFEVKPLSDKDAWDLFESKVGDVSKNQKLRKVGEGIVKECGGCPLAIVTLGSTLAQEEEYMWLDALRRLRNAEPTQLDGIIPQVITSIKFSYDYLKDKDMKFCFLFCSLFPEDYNISLEDLRIFGIGEGFLDVKRKYLDARVQLMAYIKRLKNCSLLLEGDRRNHVKMHDVVRLTAKSIASKEGQGFIEKTRLGLGHWRLDNEEECKRLSFVGNYDIKALRESSNFPQLRTLLLKDCFAITHIPNDFFISMHALVNLDLSGMNSLKRWPKSISLLTNLRSLLLDFRSGLFNKSFDIDLGKLKKLEVLIIYGEVIIYDIDLGKLKKLSNLKILNLKRVHLELIPANVISRLHNLEELYLDITQFDEEEIFYRKEGGCKGTNEIRSAASLVEVAALKRLTVLEVRVREEEVALFQDNSYIMLNNGWGHELQEFKIVIGNNFLATQDFFESSGNTLEVKHCCKLVNLLPPNLLQALPLLGKLNISNCRAMKHIFVTSTTTDQGSSSGSANYNLETRNCFEHLVDLELENMPNLVRICDGPVPDGFLKNLKRVTVTNCGKLAPDVFSQDLVHCTENIKEIHLEKFSSYLSISATASERLNITDQIEKKMETILLRLGRPGSIHLFQNLTVLSIEKCPTLKSICSFDSTSSTGSITAYSQDLYSCHQHHFLPQLQELSLQDLTNLVNICDGPVCFGSQLVNVKVERCGKLERVFSLSNMDRHGFQKLQELSVINCVKMKAIFIVTEGEEEEKVEGVVPPTMLESCLLPQLRRLIFMDLPELLSFCSWDRFHFPISSPSLSYMPIENCPKLGHYILDYQEPRYQYSIQHREQYEVQAPNYVVVLFGNAAISNPNPPYFQMIPLLGTENNLKELIVGDLSKIQHVFCLEKEVEGGGNKYNSIFTELEELYLERLEKLDSIIWTGSNPLNIGSSSFQNLRTLKVGHCNCLRYLFSPLLAQHLPHLEILEVESCQRLEKLILISDREEESASAAGRIWTTTIEDALPQLQYLYLRNLPELTSVFSVETIFLQFPSLKRIRVFHCSKLKHLSLGPNSSPQIWGSQEWLQALEEDMTMEMKSRFKPLFFEMKADVIRRNRRISSRMITSRWKSWPI